jgi:Lon protease-like protein
MVEGELGNVVPDTAADPVTAALAATEEAQIGCYVGVPVRLSDGRVYGSLCVASRVARRELDATSTHFARVCARLIADVVEQRELETVNRRLQGEVTGVRASSPRSTRATATPASTPRRSSRWPPTSGDGSGWPTTTWPPSSRSRCCTTSARSACPTRSCRSPAR